MYNRETPTDVSHGIDHEKFYFKIFHIPLLIEYM